MTIEWFVIVLQVGGLKWTLILIVVMVGFMYSIPLVLRNIQEKRSIMVYVRKNISYTVGQPSLPIFRIAMFATMIPVE